MNIKHDSCFELIATLYAIAQKNQIDRLLKSKSIKTSSTNYHRIVEKLIKLLPKDLYSNVIHYFDLHGIGYIIYNVYFKCLNGNHSSPDIKTFINEVKQLKYEDALIYLTVSNYGLEFSNLYENTIHSVLSEVIYSQPHPDDKRKKNMIKALLSKDYIKELISTVEAFYKLYDQFLMSHVSSLGNNAAKRYHELYHDDPKEFHKRFLLPQVKQITHVIHISILAPLGITIYQSKWQDINCYLIGELQDQVYSSMNPIDKIAFFHKILSDPKRIEMITLLSQKPYYGQELAQSMNLATSTISYHLNLLNDLGLLKFTREHKKVYYHFDQNTYDSLLAQHSSFLFQQPSH